MEGAGLFYPAPPREKTPADEIVETWDHLNNLLSPTISSQLESGQNASSSRYFHQTFEDIGKKFTKQASLYSDFDDVNHPVPGEVCGYADFFKNPGELKLRLCWKPKEGGEEREFICPSPPRLSWVVFINKGREKRLNRQRTSAQWFPKSEREHPYITQDFVIFRRRDLEKLIIGNRLQITWCVFYHPSLSPLDEAKIAKHCSKLCELVGYRKEKIEVLSSDEDGKENEANINALQSDEADYQCDKATGKPGLNEHLKQLSAALCSKAAGAETSPLIEKEIRILQMHVKAEEELYTSFEQIGPFRTRFLIICLSKEPQDGEDSHGKFIFKISLCVRPGSDGSPMPFWPVTMHWVVSQGERVVGKKCLIFSRPPDDQDSVHSFNDSIDLEFADGMSSQQVRLKYRLKIVPSLLDHKAQPVRDSLDGIKESLSGLVGSSRASVESERKLLDEATMGQSEGFEYDLHEVFNESSSLCEATVMLVGSHSAGKTETANSLLQRGEFWTNRAVRVTMEACTKQRRYALKVVDTPGVGSNEDNVIVPVQTMLSQALLRCKPGFQALLFVINFENFSEIDLNAAQIVKNTFGEDILRKFGICIITHADAFRSAAPGISFFEWRAHDCEKVWGEEARKLLEEFYSRCVLFDNNSTDPDVIKCQIENVVGKISLMLGHGPKVTYTYSDLTLHMYKSIQEKISPLVEQTRELVHETEDGPWERKQSELLDSLETLIKTDAFVDASLSEVCFENNADKLESLYADIGAYEPSPGQMSHQSTHYHTLAAKIVHDIESYTDDLQEFLESTSTFPLKESLSRLARCRKHRGHRKFFPVNKFGVDNIETLPPGLNKEAVIKWVKCWASLVVKTVGTFVSGQRPEREYPLCHRKGEAVEQLGSGYISGVLGPLSDVCPCKSCESACALSKRRKTMYYQIRICSSCVIFDEIEASKGYALLFFDRPDGSGARKITLSTVLGADTDKDCCVLLCYLHDLTLGHQLQELCRERSELIKSFSPILRDYLSYQMPVFVISHPHGYVKQISVGDYEDRKGEMLIYRVPTCPGSAGGLVLPLGLLPASDSLNGLASFAHSEARSRDVGSSATQIRWWWLG